MYTNDWFSQNITNWSMILADIIGKPDLRFLEIGCYEGMATHWMCSRVLTSQDSIIDVVDTFEGSMEHHDGNAPTDFSVVETNFRENLAEYISQNKVNIYKTTSQKYLRDISAEMYDFIYIDGSHTSPDVLEDAVLSWRLLKSGGIMIFDDYGWCAYPENPELNPKLAIDSFMAVMTGQFSLLHKGYQVAIKKM